MSITLAAPFQLRPVYREVPDDIDSLIFERRHGARTSIARPVRVIELTNGRHIAGRSRDLSSIGMRIEIPLASGMRVGDVVQVDVGSLSGIGPLTHRPRVIPARVVWLAREQKMLRPLQTVGLVFEIEDDAVVRVA